MPPAAAGRRSSSWKRLAIACAAALLALVLGEVAHRTWRWLHHWTYDSSAMRGTLVEARNRATQPIPMPSNAVSKGDSTDAGWVLHPYNGFDQKIVYEGIDQELTLQERPGSRYSILVLGGSVAGLFSTRGAETFKAEVSGDERLRGRPVALMDLAQGAYKQPQQAIRLVWLLALGLHPDAVIEIDGFNEVAIGNSNAHQGFHPLQPSRNHWLRQYATGRVDASMEALEAKARAAKDRVVKLADFGLRFGLWRSSIAGTVLHRQVRTAQNEVSRAESEFLRRLSETQDVEGASGPPIRGGPDAGIALSVEGWAKCSESMRAICEAHSIPYLQVLQPTLHDEGAKPMTREETERGIAPDVWMEGTRKGYPMLRARGAELKAAGLNFVDASRIFADVHETLYYDSCHFNDLGMERFARFVGRAFLEVLPRRGER